MNNQQTQQIVQCPYINTIKRHLLDFDFQKVCSISLSNLNVYGCLVCGRYFQGKGKSTHAYLHSLQQNHHLFVNLQNCKIYCLPDNYEVKDSSLDDIKFNLLPIYTKKQIEQMDTNVGKFTNLDGKQYLPGYVGFNNLKHTQFINVIIQLLNRIPEIRQHFLLQQQKGLLCEKFSMLLKKIWNYKNFKGYVSPHEFLQSITQVSQKKFQIGKKQQPLSFFIWLINNLDIELKNKKSHFQLGSKFRGKLKISHFKPLKNSAGYEELSTKVQSINFLMLSIEIPTNKETNLQENLKNLLARYLGQNPHDTPEGRKFYLITQYPKYLVLSFKRFVNNGFFKEKNPTIVRFPLQMEMNSHHYRLIANICHEGSIDSGIYKIYIRRMENWIVIQDLFVQNVMTKQISISEAYMQLYQKIN